MEIVDKKIEEINDKKEKIKDELNETNKSLNQIINTKKTIDNLYHKNDYKQQNKEIRNEKNMLLIDKIKKVLNKNSTYFLYDETVPQNDIYSNLFRKVQTNIFDTYSFKEYITEGFVKIIFCNNKEYFKNYGYYIPKQKFNLLIKYASGIYYDICLNDIISLLKIFDVDKDIINECINSESFQITIHNKKVLNYIINENIYKKVCQEKNMINDYYNNLSKKVHTKCKFLFFAEFIRKEIIEIYYSKTTDNLKDILNKKII